MPYLGDFAKSTPDKPAVISAATGEQISYAELNDRSIRLANLLRDFGLVRGDTFAVLAENHLRYFELFWAALRAGYYVTFVNSHFAAEEVAYQITDSNSKAVISTRCMADTAQRAVERIDPSVRRLMIDGTVDGFGSYEQALAGASARQSLRQPRGEAMLYSSGTTGRPKGIKRPLRDVEVDDPSATVALLSLTPGADSSLVYLSPAPLYHAAPLYWSAGVHNLGGTAVVMRKFDPEEFLAAIERYRVTHTQVVPTMLVRILKLSPDRRLRYKLSSLRSLIHAAAPCPPEVKERFIEWIGPIVYEYYSGTEGSGITFITSEEWLSHRGSVGKPVSGIPHICDEVGGEVPVGTPGTVYFEQPQAPFEYHGDPQKTRMSRHPVHGNWTTIGDVGYLDGDGYLYLTDRRSFMIISGGVNIYPAEIESCLIMHEKVADVAVFGLPDPEMGEFVQAVVQLQAGEQPGPETEDELKTFIRSHLAGYKVPRRIDFRDTLPRLETGKLAKYLLRREYLAASS
jgi:acyl-CoA synthetase (AMP-forming)/AMP-acid ligase II